MTAPLSTSHAATSFHARLLVLFAEHQPHAARHLLDDTLTVECACGNPLYAGHMVRLLTDLDPTADDEVPPAPLPGPTASAASTSTSLTAGVPAKPHTPAGQGNPTQVAALAAGNEEQG